MNIQGSESQARRRAARQWVNAALAYGASLQIIDSEHGYWFQFINPIPPTGKPHPGPYPEALKNEIRAIIKRGSNGRRNLAAQSQIW